MHRRDLLGATAAAAIGIDRRWLARLLAPGGGPVVPRPTPSPAQLAWQRDELALFIHFGVNTFTDREWGDGTENPRIFNPAELDARQWVRAAKAGGFRTLILTAKHHDGFCLWPTATTDHSVRASPWRDGRGDVVREMVEACRAEGLGVGLYLSPWDRHERSYGDSPRYNDFYARQLTELLTQYGPLIEVWFDGANGEGPNGKRQEYDWPRVHRVVRALQPHAVMFSDAGPDVRWIGNERGVAGDPNWCTVDPTIVPYPGMSGEHIIRALQHGNADGTVWRPGEADVSIRPGWFWHPAQDAQVRSPDDLVDLYFSSVGRNAGLLLNVPPTTRGLFHDADVRSLTEFGQRLRDLFAVDLAAGASVSASGRAGSNEASRATDPDPDRFWQADGAASSGSPRWLEVGWREPVSFDVIAVQEAIAHGQHVERHSIAVWTGRAWSPLVSGSTIGYKRLHRVAPTRTTRLRLTIDAAFEPPRIARIAVYDSRG